MSQKSQAKMTKYLARFLPIAIGMAIKKKLLYERITYSSRK